MGNKNSLKLRKIKNNKIQVKKKSIFFYDVSKLELNDIIELIETNGQVSVIKNVNLVNIYLVISNENSNLKEYEIDFYDYVASNCRARHPRHITNNGNTTPSRRQKQATGLSRRTPYCSTWMACSTIRCPITL